MERFLKEMQKKKHRSFQKKLRITLGFHITSDNEMKGYELVGGINKTKTLSLIRLEASLQRMYAFLEQGKANC